MRATGTEDRGNPRLIPGILLAAGTASRFGRAKLLERWQGETLLRRAARNLWAAGVRPLIVVLPSDAAFRDGLAGLTVVQVENAEPERGIGHSIALAMSALSNDAQAVLIAVADQPLLTAEAVGKLLTAFRPRAIVAPRYGPHPGNPRIFDRGFFPELLSLDGDRGGQLVAERHPELVVEVELPESLGLDIDQPSDWARLKGASRSGD